MSDHSHQYFLAKFTDNSNERPATLYGQAMSENRWHGTGLFVCDCGFDKSVQYDEDTLIQALNDELNGDEQE